MADNVDFTPGSGATGATDEIDGVHYPRTKLVWGANGTATDASAAAPLPVVQTGTPALPTDAATQTTLAQVQAGIAIMDDWDESDRAKVNVIVGQAGIAAGSGTNGATVPRVTIATDDIVSSRLNDALVGDYETVAASQTAQTLGATGAAGDFISGILVIPATTSPGNVLLLDNATSITVFTGGTASVTNLVPFLIPLGMRSASGAWKLTTGANVSCIGIGNFT